MCIGACASQPACNSAMIPGWYEYLYIISPTGIEPVSSTWKDDVLTTRRKGPRTHSICYIFCSDQNGWSGSFCPSIYAIQDFVCVRSCWAKSPISDVNLAGRVVPVIVWFPHQPSYTPYGTAQYPSPHEALWSLFHHPWVNKCMNPE